MKKNTYKRCFFEAGELTKSGFLGSETRSISEIIQQDRKQLEHYGIRMRQMAERLQAFIDEGKKRLEDEIEFGDFIVRVQWDRGMIPCPFGDPGLHPKIVAYIHSKKTGNDIQYSQLSIHMLRMHDFLGGKGSCFRLEPELLVEFLKEGST
jgi:hypothetical protein